MRLTFHRFLAFLLLLGALAQPAHTVIHSLNVTLEHQSTLIVDVAGDALGSFEEGPHHHSNELCGQCQLGFMGAALPTSTFVELVAAGNVYLRIFSAEISSNPVAFTRNRDPPIA